MKPPPHLDSGKVLYWSWSGEKPFGKMRISQSPFEVEIFGFAICILAGQIYRFSCDRNWKVQNDTDFITIKEAMEADYPAYKEQPTAWNKYDDTDIDALIDESQGVKYYEEVGSRRTIQKIVSHLNTKNCNGMGVHSTDDGKWVLYIQKKDIPIASEVLSRNVEDGPAKPKKNFPKVVYREGA